LTLPGEKGGGGEIDIKGGALAMSDSSWIFLLTLWVPAGKKERKGEEKKNIYIGRLFPTSNHCFRFLGFAKEREKKGGRGESST